MSGAVSNFNLVRPCAGCPFRTDCLEEWLGARRAREIFEAITDQQATFACHKTTVEGRENDDGESDLEVHNKSEHCAGALILLEKLGRPNQMMRICERLGFYDHTKLDMDAPVFDDGDEFIEHHTDRKRSRR